jgi:transposase
VTQLICGVDVSCEALDVVLRPSGEVQRFANNREGIEALGAFCLARGVELAVMEATGGYEKTAFGLLWVQGVSVALANPRAVRRFAEAMGLLEKTDRIDAGVIAWYGEAKHIVPQRPAGAAQERLKALVTRLRQLTDLRTAQCNQRRLVSETTVLASFEEILASIARQMRVLETAIAELIAGDPLWREFDKAFRTIKGVADRTVARIMAEVPEIGTISNKAVSKLNGLAPLARDSGKTKGKRPVRGGRTGARSVLFVVAEIVRRHDPDFAAFHQRLTDAGKPKKVIRIALAHKLLVRLNAKARDVRTRLAYAA